MRLLLTLGLLFMLGGCALEQERLNHVILVWFNDDISAEQIEKVKRESYALKAIGELRYIQAGNAVESERSIVDDSFDLGLIMQFDSKEAMERYINDPRHKAFVDEHIKGKVQRVLVYDF